MTIFQLARMRPLALLGLWHRLHPDSHDMHGRPARVATLTNDQLAAAIWADRRRKT